MATVDVFCTDGRRHARRSICVVDDKDGRVIVVALPTRTIPSRVDVVDGEHSARMKCHKCGRDLRIAYSDVRKLLSNGLQSVELSVLERVLTS